MILKDNLQYNETDEWEERKLLREFFKGNKNGKRKLPKDIESAIEQFTWFNYTQQNGMYGEKLSEKIRAYLEKYPLRTYLKNLETLKDNNGY